MLVFLLVAESSFEICRTLGLVDGVNSYIDGAGKIMEASLLLSVVCQLENMMLI